MGTRTLYVSDEDQEIWSRAQAQVGDSGESLSKLATEGLRILISTRDSLDEVDLTPKDIDVTSAAERMFKEVRQLGWEKAGMAFARACLNYGAARSRAKQKAEATLGSEGRHAAAVKAHATKGSDGRKAAARKAWGTRHAKKSKKTL